MRSSALGVYAFLYNIILLLAIEEVQICHWKWLKIKILYNTIWEANLILLFIVIPLFRRGWCQKLFASADLYSRAQKMYSTHTRYHGITPTKLADLWVGDRSATINSHKYFTPEIWVFFQKKTPQSFFYGDSGFGGMKSWKIWPKYRWRKNQANLITSSAHPCPLSLPSSSLMAPVSC